MDEQGGNIHAGSNVNQPGVAASESKQSADHVAVKTNLPFVGISQFLIHAWTTSLGFWKVPMSKACGYQTVPVAMYSHR